MLFRGRSLRIVTLALSALVSATALYGCGKLKSRDDRVVVIGQSGTQATADSTNSGDEVDQKIEETVRNIRELYDLYTHGDGLTKDEATNLMKKFNGKADPQLLDMLFKLDSNGDGKLTLPEISDGIVDQIPTLGWVQKGEKLGPDQLAGDLLKTYPGSSPAAIAGMMDMLMRFDKPFMGGNGDGALDRKELVMPGIIMGFMSKLDFSHGIPTQGNVGPEMALKLEEIEKKINKQIWGRYGDESNYRNLPKADISMEWMQFGLRYYLVSTLVAQYGATTPNGKAIDDAHQVDAIAAYGLTQIRNRADGWLKLRHLYDNAINLGDGDGKLNTLETLNFITDMEYAVRFIQSVGGSIAPANLRTKPALYKHLMTIYPRVGWDLFLTSGSDIRDKYWNGMAYFDTPDRGGNGDNRLDSGEITYAFAEASFLEHLFALYDTNGDHMMQKTEAHAILDTLQIPDDKVLDLFYTDAAADLDLTDPNVLSQIDNLLASSGSKSVLSPFEFYIRMDKMMGKIVK